MPIQEAHKLSPTDLSQSPSQTEGNSSISPGDARVPSSPKSKYKATKAQKQEWLENHKDLWIENPEDLGCVINVARLMRTAGLFAPSTDLTMVSGTLGKMMLHLRNRGAK